MSAPKWSVGMRKIGPGMYVSNDQALHLDTDELCRAMGMAPTPNNVKAAEELAQEVVRKAYGNIPVSHVED